MTIWLFRLRTHPHCRYPVPFRYAFVCRSAQRKRSFELNRVCASPKRGELQPRVELASAATLQCHPREVSHGLGHSQSTISADIIRHFHRGFCNALNANDCDLASSCCGGHSNEQSGHSNEQGDHSNEQLDCRILCTAIWFC